MSSQNQQNGDTSEHVERMVALIHFDNLTAIMYPKLAPHGEYGENQYCFFNDAIA